MHPIAGGGMSPFEAGVFSLVVYTVVVALFISSQLFLAAWLGAKKKSTEKSRPYECGIIPTGSARFRFPVPFYLVAIFFLIFDVEGAFILTWAVVYWDVGAAGYVEMAFFIILLLFGLFYIWKHGGLDWKEAYRQAGS